MGVKRPWNIVNMPIYSLATYEGDKVNMNICTYVTAVSMKPKLFMVAIDYTTKTYANLEKEGAGVLQILHLDHASLINRLGKKSGKTTDKEAYLEKHNLLDQWNGSLVLKDACGYMQFKQTGRQNVGGDHELFLFEVVKSKTVSEQGVLMFQDLVDKGIIL